MGVGALAFLFWMMSVSFAATAVFMAGQRVGYLKGRTGVGVVARMTDKALRCRVCGNEFMPADLNTSTDTCGHPGCVRAIMVGRARMAAVRQAVETQLRRKMVQAYRESDGTPMFKDDGTQVTVGADDRDGGPVWERVHVDGGNLTARDREALAWVAQHGKVD